MTNRAYHAASEVSEPRTIREMREQIRDLEDGARRVREADAMALAERTAVAWYLRKARLALRQAERALAERDDDPEPLEPLRAQIRDRRPLLRAPRKRYRCTDCFEESLRGDEDHMNCYRRKCEGTVEPVAKLRRKP